MTGDDALRKYREVFTYSKNRLARTDRRELARQLLDHAETKMTAQHQEQRLSPEARGGDLGLLAQVQVLSLETGRPTATPTVPAFGVPSWRPGHIVPAPRAVRAPQAPPGPLAPLRSAQPASLHLHVKALPVPLPHHPAGRARPTTPRSQARPTANRAELGHASGLHSDPGEGPGRRVSYRPPALPANQLLRRRRSRYWVSPREIRHCVSRASSASPSPPRPPRPLPPLRPHGRKPPTPPNASLLRLQSCGF